jgi:hypothetical protein
MKQAAEYYVYSVRELMEVMSAYQGFRIVGQRARAKELDGGVRLGTAIWYRGAQLAWL